MNAFIIHISKLSIKGYNLLKKLFIFDMNFINSLF